MILVQPDELTYALQWGHLTGDFQHHRMEVATSPLTYFAPNVFKHHSHGSQIPQNRS